MVATTPAVLVLLLFGVIYAQGQSKFYIPGYHQLLLINNGANKFQYFTFNAQTCTDLNHIIKSKFIKGKKTY